METANEVKGVVDELRILRLETGVIERKSELKEKEVEEKSGWLFMASGANIVMYPFEFILPEETNLKIH